MRRVGWSNQKTKGRGIERKRSMAKNLDTQDKFKSYIQSAREKGLSRGQFAILCAIDQWDLQNPETGPSTTQIANIARLSISTVYWFIPVLTELGYITANYDSKGHRVKGSIRIIIDPEDAQLRDDFDPQKVLNLIEDAFA